MAWTPFSAEAVRLHGEIGRLDKQGRISDALELIVRALDKAHRDGPEKITYEQFEAECDAKFAEPT